MGLSLLSAAVSDLGLPTCASDAQLSNVVSISRCSSMALSILGMYNDRDKPYNHVSQALNTTFHAPAPRSVRLSSASRVSYVVPDPCFSSFSVSDSGVKIEIVNTTVSFGARTVSAVAEVSPRFARAPAYLSQQRLTSLHLSMFAPIDLGCYERAVVHDRSP